MLNVDSTVRISNGFDNLVGKTNVENKLKFPNNYNKVYINLSTNSSAVMDQTY